MGFPPRIRRVMWWGPSSTVGRAAEPSARAAPAARAGAAPSAASPELTRAAWERNSRRVGDSIGDSFLDGRTLLRLHLLDALHPVQGGDLRDEHAVDPVDRAVVDLDRVQGRLLRLGPRAG